MGHQHRSRRPGIAAGRRDAGRVQPPRDELIAQQGANVVYHYHAIQAWRVESTGEVKNVYA